MNKKKVAIIAIIIAIFSFFTIIIIANQWGSNHLSEVNQNIKSNEKAEILPINEYYNKAYIISMNVYLRLNQLPLIEDTEDLVKMKKEIEAFEKNLNEIDSNEDISEAKNKLGNLIELAYETIDLTESRIYKEDFDSATYWSKLDDALDQYISFSKLFDTKRMVFTQDTLEQIDEIMTYILGNYPNQEQITPGL